MIRSKSVITICKRRHAIGLLRNSRSITTESNILTETNRAEKTSKRFWKNVNVLPYNETTIVKGLKKINETGHMVTLDGRPIKTPSGFPLVVPHYRNPALSHLIAQEWSAITSAGKIESYSLPLTSLAAQAIDLEYGETGRITRETSRKQLLPYLDTDVMLVFSPRKDCDGRLREEQEKQYRPWISFAEKYWGTALNSLDTEKSFFGNIQTAETKKIVSDWMTSLDSWQYSALERATTVSKSLIGGMLLITGKLSSNQVADLVDLETICQTERWGLVEDFHDVQNVDLRRMLGSSYLIGAKREVKEHREMPEIDIV